MNLPIGMSNRFRIVIGAVVLVSALSINACASHPPDPTSTTIPPAIPVSLTASITSPPTSLTDTATPVFSPTTPVGSTLFEETFTDNHNNWYSKDPLVAVVDGKYTHILDCPESNPASQCGNFIRIPFTFPASFRLQIEVNITKSSDSNGVMFGIQVRKSDEGYYYLNYLITNGAYEMSRITQTGEFSILPETHTEFIKSVVGETNKLGIEVKGAEFTPLVNDQQLPPLQEGNIRTAGDAYLVVLVERGHAAEVQLDNLIVERNE